MTQEVTRGLTCLQATASSSSTCLPSQGCWAPKGKAVWEDDNPQAPSSFLPFPQHEKHEGAETTLPHPSTGDPEILIVWTPRSPPDPRSPDDISVALFRATE